jgi:uncharacterized protein YegL
MFTSQLSTVQANILSHNFIPENVRPLVVRRTENGKTFGKLEIIASPPDLIARSDKYPPRNIIAGFLLDTSRSMDGAKISKAVNTIKQLAQIILEERNGKTLEHQPIHAWIYVISFDSTATVRIPFQEITEETLPGIISELDLIRTQGSTNYEVAFKKQTEVVSEILQFIAADPAKRQFHLIRFFETDGEITHGTREIWRLYGEMRRTTTKTVSGAPHREEHNVTFEDCVIGYDTGIDLKCLKELASPTPPSRVLEQYSDVVSEAVVAAATATASDALYNCSSLITVVRPEDIGWQVGEILYKQIMRVGIKLTVSVESKNPAEGVVELFGYQTNQWSHSTIFHSIIHNERKALYIQFTPTTTTATAATQPEIIVRVQCENQRTGSKYTYEFLHQPSSSSSLTPLLLRPYNSMTLVEKGLACADSERAIQAVIPIIQGMIHIEIFKQFRELEGNNYDKDVIVREAYNTLRMLKAIGAKTNERFIHSIAPKTANMITDVKLIIGLTAINNATEQHCIIHARRTASAEKDMFNTGVTASRKYVEGEEEYETIAREIIQRRDGEHQQQQQQQQPAPEEAPAEFEYDDVSDCILSRIPTSMMTQPSNNGGGHHHHNKVIKRKPSILRILCARIALSKLKNQDRSPETIYSEMKQESLHYGGHYDEDPSYYYTSTTTQDDAFSTPTQDDEYTQRRMGMMRQMSSPSSS